MNKERSKIKQREKEIPEKKLKTVDRLAELIKKNNTTMIVSIKRLPSHQFQEIKKKLKETAEIKVAKKSIIIRALEKAGLTNLKDYVKEDIAFIFSELDPFELSLILSENRSAASAKAGQTAEDDIVAEAGPTEFVPGPVISELGNFGIKIAIEDGKINIKEKKIVVKKGEKVSTSVASLLQKLDIKPFTVGFIPVIAYHSASGKIYENLIIDKKKTIEKIRDSYTKAESFALSIFYICKETIKFLIAKASREEKTIEKLIKKE